MWVCLETHNVEVHQPPLEQLDYTCQVATEALLYMALAAITINLVVQCQEHRVSNVVLQQYGVLCAVLFLV